MVVALRMIPLLLCIGVVMLCMLCIAEGFVVWVRPTSVGVGVSVGVSTFLDQHQPRYYCGGFRSHTHALSASVTDSTIASSTTSTSTTASTAFTPPESAEVLQMASFVCIALAKKVLAKATDNCSHDSKIALERLVVALPNETKTKRNTTVDVDVDTDASNPNFGLPPDQDIAGVSESTRDLEQEGLSLELDKNNNKHKHNNKHKITTNSPTQATPTLNSGEEEEDDEEPSLENEREDLLLPLQNEALLKGSEQLLLKSEALLRGSDELLLQTPNDNDDDDDDDTDWMLSANVDNDLFSSEKVWKLDDILTSVTDDTFKTKTSKDTTAVTTIGIRETETPNELFHRKLLQRRLDVVATSVDQSTVSSSLPPTKRVVSEIETAQDNVDDDAPAQEQERNKLNELFQRRLFQQRMQCDAKREERRAIDESSTSPPKSRIHIETKPSVLSKEVFQRKLLQTRLKFAERFDTRQRKRTQELFQRQLLEAGLVYDSHTEAKRRQKAQELLQRELLRKRLELEVRSTPPIQREMHGKREGTTTEAGPEVPRAMEIPSPPIESGSKVREAFQRKLLEERLKQRGETNELIHRRLLQETFESESQSDLDDLSEKQMPLVDIATSVEERDDASSLEEDAMTHPVPEATAPYGSSQEINDPIPQTDAANGESASSLPTVPGERYAREAMLSHSFPEQKFNPTWWSKNNHFQTIIGTLFRKETMYSKGSQDMDILRNIAGFGDETTEEPLDEFQWDERKRVETPDGDFFVVDWKYANEMSSQENDNPICLICHGLESCSDSEIARELAMACNEIHIDAACLNFRGCSDSGEECNLTERAYHLGFTDDLMQQIRMVHDQNPHRRIYLSGFSLGAGVVTKLLADLGPDAYRYNICGAAVNAVPFATYQNYRVLNEPSFTKFVYGDRLLQSMKRRLHKAYDTVDFPFSRWQIDACKTIVDMENLMIAPAFGFDDAFDYYRKVQTLDKLDRVSVPEFILQARDDPFFEGLDCPPNDPSRPLRIQYTDDGGHCGYIFHQLRDLEERPKTSWMPHQLARFLAHLDEHHRSTDEVAAAPREEIIALAHQ